MFSQHGYIIMSRNITQAPTFPQLFAAADAIHANNLKNTSIQRQASASAPVIEREYEFIPPPGLRIESVPTAEYRVAEVENLKQILHNRHSSLVRIERSHKALEVIAAMFGLYAIGVTILMLGV